MDSCRNTNLPYTQTEFSSYALSKSISDKKSRWISPSPKRKTRTQMIVSKKDEVKNTGTSNTKNVEKRKSSLIIPDIDSKIKRLEALHEETTTSDSDTTITKIDRLSKKRKLYKPGEESSDSEDLCKILKSVNNTVNELTVLHPFSREEDIKIIMYFHKFMELLAHKDDIYVYQLLDMKYHFQRSAKFLQDRFLNEILPNLYVYECLSLEEMVVFYDRADMFVPKHVQNMIQEKVRSITGHCISSPESAVITISESENEETDFIENENVKSPCSSKGSSIIQKRRNRVLQLPSSPSICGTSVSENVRETVHNSDQESCNNSPEAQESENEETNLIENENVKSPCSSESSFILSNRNNRLLKLPSVICNASISEKASNSDSCINSEVLSVTKEPNAVNVVNMWDSANNKSIETCQLLNNSDLEKHSSTSVNLCDENKCHRNVKNSETEHSDNVNRDKVVENITTNTCATADGSSGCVSLSACLFETNDKQHVKCVKNCNKQNAKHEKLVSVTTNISKTVQSSNCNSNEVTKSSQTVQNDQSHENFIFHSDHTYVKLPQLVDISLENESVQQVPDNTSSCSSETAAVNMECISIKNPDHKISITNSAETSSREQKIQHSVKSISEQSFVDASTNTEAPVMTELSSLESNNIDSISCLECDAIVLRSCGTSNVYVSKKAIVKRIAKQHEILENSIHLTDSKNMEILQCYTNYKNNINAAMKIFTENDKEVNHSRYNLRKFVKNPRDGTCTRGNIHWCRTGKRNAFDLLTEDCPSKAIKKRIARSRHTQRMRKLFGGKQLPLRKSKLRNKSNKALWSPASDQSDKTVSSATSSSISDTSTMTKSDTKIYKKLSSGIVIRRTYVKNHDKSDLNKQISKASPGTEEINQTGSSVTSVSSVSNKPVSLGSDKPAITEINKNTSVTMLEPSAISHIKQVRNDYQKRIFNRPDSDIHSNTISPSISDKSNCSLSSVISTSDTNKSPEDSSPESVICSIKNNFEKRVYEKLDSLYRIRKPDSSLINEEPSQAATSTLAAKKLVYIQINKNTGDILGLRPMRASTDQKVISNTGASRAMSVIDSVTGQRRSESADLTSTVSGSDNVINARIDETISEETISSTDRRVNAYYDMEINIFEDLPCEYDPMCSWDDATRSVQKNQNLVKKPNELIVSTSRMIRNTAPGECTDEYSVIKPTRTYQRKTAARTNSPESSCTVSVKTESDDSQVKLEPLDSSVDSGLEMIASQLLLSSSIASTSSRASDDVIPIPDSPNCILDFLVDDIKTELQETASKKSRTNILDPIYETLPVNREDVNITSHSFSTISEADSVWATLKRIMSIFESPNALDEGEFACRRVVVKTKNTHTDANVTSTTRNEENDVRVKRELIGMTETIKQEWITDSDSWDTYPEMVFDCAKIKQEISILESNTMTSGYFDEDNFDPVLPVQLPNENFQTHLNMSRKLKTVVAENRLSIHHLKPVTEYATEPIIKTEYSAGTELE